MGTPSRASCNVLALLVLAAAARAEELPAQIVLDTCFATNFDAAYTSIEMPLPGTLVFDMHYEIEAAQGLTGLIVNAASDPSGGFSFGGAFGPAWCPGAPCSGDVDGIAIPVETNDVVTFWLDATELGCVGNNGTLVTLHDLHFVPEPGVHAVGGGVATGLLFEEKLTSTYVSNTVGGLAELGDVSGDGVADWAYGIPGGGLESGEVHLVSGANGALLHVFKDFTFKLFGGVVVDAGDVDGDGVDDLAVSEAYWPDSFHPKGRVHVYSGDSHMELFVVSGTQEHAGFGAALDGAGDVNGDGLCDLLIGASFQNGPGGNLMGEVRVVSGSNQSVLFSALGDNANDRLGADVAGLGDADADGVPDLAASAPYYPAGGIQGLVRVWSGATQGLLHSFTGTFKFEPLEKVGAAGDVDGDSHADVLTGAPTAWKGSSFAVGLARLRSGATGASLFSVRGTAENEKLGFDVAGAGDVDGDGLQDVLISAFGWQDHGRVRVHAGPDGEVLSSIEPKSGLLAIGVHVDGGADLDSDGVPDVVLSAQTPDYDGRVLGYSGVPGSSSPPALGATGTLLPSSPLTISLGGGPPGGLAVLVVGLDAEPLPFKGGVLVPQVDLLLGLPLQPDGSLALPTFWPAGLGAPLGIVLQAWCADAAAIQGFVGSNALLLAPP